MPPIAASDISHLLVAALGGAAVGLERQWSGHATGPRARFAGVRTFTLFGGGSGLAGWLCQADAAAMAVVLLAGLIGLIVVGYARASERDVGATTEAAAVIVCGAGVLAGLGMAGLASGIVATTCLVLVEKTRLHGWIARIDENELTAGVRFAVMAVVILPLLPEGPYGPWGGIRPRGLWMLVLFFSGISFVGYIARQLAGARVGYPLAGLLGGLVSSTNVTISFSRSSRSVGAAPAALATGVLAASTILFIRVIVTTAVLNRALSWRLLPLFLPAFLVGLGAVLFGIRRLEQKAADETGPPNPLEFWTALQLAAIFQVVLLLMPLVRGWFGSSGLLASGAVLGFTDMDALTLSMAQQVSSGVSVDVAAGAVVAGILSNTVLEIAASLVLGGGTFRPLAALGLGVMGATLGATAWLALR